MSTSRRLRLFRFAMARTKKAAKRNREEMEQATDHGEEKGLTPSATSAKKSKKRKKNKGKQGISPPPGGWTTPQQQQPQRKTASAAAQETAATKDLSNKELIAQIKQLEVVNPSSHSTESSFTRPLSHQEENSRLRTVKATSSKPGPSQETDPPTAGAKEPKEGVIVLDSDDDAEPAPGGGDTGRTQGTTEVSSPPLPSLPLHSLVPDLKSRVPTVCAALCRRNDGSAERKGGDITLFQCRSAMI